MHPKYTNVKYALLYKKIYEKPDFFFFLLVDGDWTVNTKPLYKQLNAFLAIYLSYPVKNTAQRVPSDLLVNMSKSLAYTQARTWVLHTAASNVTTPPPAEWLYAKCIHFIFRGKFL